MKTIVVNGQLVTFNNVHFGIDVLEQLGAFGKHGAVAGVFTNAELEYIHGYKKERYESRY